jgi:hypothetical protein
LEIMALSKQPLSIFFFSFYYLIASQQERVREGDGWLILLEYHIVANLIFDK